MARQSKYSEQERTSAIERAFGGGATPARVAAELGVSVPTLYRWAQAPKNTDHAGDDAVAQRLIGAAEQLLRGASYPDITMEDVARHAEVPLRTAFARFASKRALFGAAVDHAAQAIVDEMSARSAQLQWPADPIARVRLFLVVNSSATYDHPASHVLFRDLGVPIEDRFAERWHDTFRVALTTLLEEVDAAGGLRDDVDPPSAGAVLARALRGVHIAVFEGVPRDLALAMIDRLPLLVTRGEHGAASVQPA